MKNCRINYCDDAASLALMAGSLIHHNKLSPNFRTKSSARASVKGCVFDENRDLPRQLMTSRRDKLTNTDLLAKVQPALKSLDTPRDTLAARRVQRSDARAMA